MFTSAATNTHVMQSIVAEQRALTHRLTHCKVTANVLVQCSASAKCNVDIVIVDVSATVDIAIVDVIVVASVSIIRNSNDIILTQPHGVTVKQTINSTRKQSTNDSHVSTINNNFNNKGSVGSRPML